MPMYSRHIFESDPLYIHGKDLASVVKRSVVATQWYIYIVETDQQIKEGWGTVVNSTGM